MVNTEIDYSNTIIYKITCKDSLVTDVYVGHTINFVQRKHAHKQSCSNEKSLNYKCKLYEVIRNNGGWTNWHMEIVNFYNCRDHCEARQKEQEYFVLLNATLNSIEPFPIPKIKKIVVKKEIVEKEFYCIKCNINCKSANLLELHNSTKKHIKRTILLPTQEVSKYICNKCDYNTDKKSSFDKHLASRKHLFNQSSNLCNSKVADNFICSTCDKIYNSRVTLWRHKKICQPLDVPLENVILDASNSEITLLTNLVFEIVKNNTELQKQLLDLSQHKHPLIHS